MAKAKIVLFTSKTYKDGTHPIMLRVSHQRKSKYFSLKVNCTRQHWDKERSRLLRSFRGYANHNAMLDFWQQKADEIIAGFIKQDTSFSFAAFEREFTTQSGGASVLNFLEELIADLLKKDKVGNYNVYYQLKNILGQFLDGKAAQFSDVDYRFLKRFESYLFARGCKEGGAHFYMRTLRATINEAIRQGVMSRDLYPFSTQFNKSGYSLSHLRGTAQPRPLAQQDMAKIKAFPFDDHPHLATAVRFFLFSYYARGMNFVDMAKLKWSDIYDGRIVYIRTKTGKRYTIKISKSLLQLLDHFKGSHHTFVFPILTDAHTTPLQIKNRCRKQLHRYNLKLRAVAELLDINIRLTSYVARHTYATTLKRSGIPIAVISEGLGHSNVSTTKAYLEQFSTDVVDTADSVL